MRDQHISFTLTRPSPDFLERLALPYFCPVPRNTLIKTDGVGVFTGPAPAGAGPYSFSGFVWNGEYEILKRNPNYGGSRPQPLDAIAFREGIDTEDAVERVERGAWEGIQDYNALLAPSGEVPRRFRAHASAVALYRAFPQTVTTYVALNARRAPFSNVKLRRAVAIALDRATLATAGGYLPTSRLLPPSVRGGETPLLGDTDIARARRLVGARHHTVRMAGKQG